jgi:hypothetical protein
MLFGLNKENIRALVNAAILIAYEYVFKKLMKA